MPSVTPVTAALAISAEFPRNPDVSLATPRIAGANVRRMNDIDANEAPCGYGGALTGQLQIEFRRNDDVPLTTRRPGSVTLLRTTAGQTTE
jgi:hypothetical protein